MSSFISAILRLSYPIRNKLHKLFNSGFVLTNNQPMGSTNTIYKYKIAGIAGNEIAFDSFKGKKILLVNTASECGFTPQYKSLQKLHELYGDRLAVIGFPSNNFGNQEPGNENEIMQFCKQEYGVSFPLTQKVDVIGENQHEIFQWLTTKELNGWNDRNPNWNFCKYLVNEDGQLVNFFSHKLDPLDPQITSVILSAKRDE